MLKITITVEEENLDYLRKAESPTFEMAVEHLGVLERNYEMRQRMEVNEDKIIDF